MSHFSDSTSSTVSDAYRPGDVVELGSFSYQVTVRVPQQFGVNELYHCQSTRDQQPVYLALKYFRFDYAAAMAEEGYHVFQRVRDNLTTLGVPDILAFHDRHQLVEFVPGSNLSQLAIEHDGLTISQIHAIALQIVDQLSVCMELGVLHNDVKPPNIMTSLENTDSSKPSMPQRSTLIDWDIARPVDDTSGQFFGAAPYMSPEKVQRTLHRTSDLFAFGITILELLCNKRYGLNCHDIMWFPDRPEHLEQFERERIAGTWLRSDAFAYAERCLIQRNTNDVLMAKQLLNFFKVCTRQNPEERPQSGKEMRQILTT